MKQTLKLFTILAALALMMPACSDEEQYPNLPPEGGGGASSSLTFTFPGKRQPVTYTPGSDSENQVDSLEIFMFNDESGKLEKVFRVGEDSLKQSGTELKATIDVTGRTGKRIFYFAANGAGNAASLADVNPGSTTEEDFKSRLTDIQEGLIGTPLLMTAKQEIADIETPTDDEKKVSLTRRVARFDVQNDASATNFTIGNILIENVKQQGYAFGDAVAVPGETLATGKHPLIKDNDPADFNNGNLVESAFYLYPTELGEGKTVISLEGEFMGERRIYSLKSNTQIEANKRYVLNVKKVEKNEPEVGLRVLEWADDGGTHEAEPETNDMTVEAATLTGGAGIQVEGKSYDISDATAAGTLTIPVRTYNQAGTRVDVTYLHGTGNGTDRIIVDSPDPVLTYGAGYEQKHKITIPIQTTPLHARIEVVNISKPEERDTLYINGVPNYDTTNEKPVLFGNIYWAPLNVGATEMGNSTELKHTGYYYQWGRNKGFVYNSSDDLQAGPVSYEQATTGIYKDKFITNSSNTHDWLTPQDDDSWSGIKAQGPCPEGWRVPSKTEFELIKKAYGDSYDSNGGTVTRNSTTGHIEIKGDDSEKILYFSAVGRRFSDGIWNLWGTVGRYWASEPGGILGTYLAFESSGLDVFNYGYRAIGFSVRCVQQ